MMRCCEYNDLNSISVFWKLYLLVIKGAETRHLRVANALNLTKFHACELGANVKYFKI